MSNHEIYDIGTNILYEPSFDHNSTQKAPLSINKYRLFQLDETYISAVQKPDLKHSVFFIQNLNATLDSQFMKYFVQKAPAGRLSG